MIYIDFFGGLHGNFLDYSINALDDAVKKTTPFNHLGTSHKRYDKPLAVAKHFSFFQIPVPDMQSMISIVVDLDDCLLVNLLNFNRAGDYNFDLYNLEVDFAKKISGTAYFDGFRQSLLHYGIDISQGDEVPRSVLRECLKYNFIDLKQNSLMQAIAQQKYVSNSLAVPLKIFYNVDLYLKQMQQIVDHFQLPYHVDTDWYCDLWQVFMSKNTVPEQIQQTQSIIHAVNNSITLEIPSLNILQEAWINAQLENQYTKEMPANDNQWFTNTKDILKFVNK